MIRRRCRRRPPSKNRSTVLPLLLLAALSALPMALAPGAAAHADALDVDPVALLAGVALPPPPLTVAVGRVDLPPGAATVATTPTGARLFAVEAGTVTVKLAGTASQRAAAVAPFGLGGPGGEMRLRAGSALTVPAELIEEVRNDGPVPAVALDAAAFPAAPRPLAAEVVTAGGVSFRLLAGGRLDDLPPGPVQLFLRRVTLPAGAELPPGLADGIALLHVEAGTVQLRPTAGRATVSGATSWPQLGPGAEPAVVGRGQGVELPEGASAVVPHGADADAVNTGTAPAALLVLTIHGAAISPTQGVG